MVKVTETSYKCNICKCNSEQISHHKTHLKTKTHKTKRDKFVFKLEKLESDELQEKYGFDDIDDIIEDFETVKIVKDKVGDSPTREWENITTSDALREAIHEIHNFLRNNGAGYGMNALKVFNLFYGLKRIEDSGTFDKTGLDEVCKFSKLYEIAKRSGKDSTANEELISTIRRDVMKNIYENERMKKFLFYILPEIKPAIYVELIKKIQSISDVEERCGEHLSGKIYEYFIGRDKIAISEMGAYFTNRQIVNFIYSHLDIELEEDGSVPEMIDPFGGSGGFTIAYVNYLNQKYDDIDWTKNIKKVHHYDMSEDVVKSAALEFFCITGHFPGDNFGFFNSFTSEFRDKKYKYIVTNPPYGGDKKSTKKGKQKSRRDKIKEYIEKGLKEDNFDESEIDNIKDQLSLIKQDEKADIKRFELQKVSLKTSSNRIKKFATKHELKANDKESVSLIQFMDMLEKGGTCCGVLKEGVFFDRNYKDIRKVLIENFNVKKVISVSSNQFENTTTKTSIIIFENTGPTKKVEFHNLIFDTHEKDQFEIIDGKVTLVKNKDDITNAYSEMISNATIKEILKNNIFSLDGKDYKPEEMIPGDGYELVKLGDICKFKGGKHILKEDLINGLYPFIGGGIKPNGYHNQYNTEERTILCSCAGNNSGFISIYNCKVWAGACFSIISKTINNIYIYYILKCFQTEIYGFQRKSGQPNVTIERISKLQIPIPKSKKKIKEWTDLISEPFNLKNKYSSKIEKMEKKIWDRILKIVENEECDEVELGDICEFTSGKFNSKDCKERGKYPFYTGKAIQPEGFTDDYCYNEKEYIILIKDGGAGYGKYGDQIGLGNVFLVSGKSGFTSHQYAVKIVKYFFSIKYLFFSLRINKNKIMDLAKYSTGLGTISKTELSKFKLKIPKDNQLIDDMNPLFEKIEGYQKIEKEASDNFNELLEDLRKESIKE